MSKVLALSKWFPSPKRYGKIGKYEHFGQQHLCSPRTAEVVWVPVQPCCRAQAALTLLRQGTLLRKHNSSPGDGHFRAVFLNCLKLKEHPTLLKKTYRSPWKASPQLSPSAIQGQNFACWLLAFAPFSSRLAFCTCESTRARLVTPNSVPDHFSMSYGSPVAPGPRENKSRLQYCKNDVCPHFYLTKSEA